VKFGIHIRLREGLDVNIWSYRSLIKIGHYFYDDVNDSLDVRRKKINFMSEMELVAGHPNG
jgi:hypothetical protein